MATDIIKALGAGSGIDTKKLVSDLVAAQKAPEQNRITKRTEALDSQLSAYGIYKSSLAEFQKVLTPLADPNLFNAKSINVPTTDVLSFNSLNASAQAGNYQIEVEKVATSQSLAFNSSSTDSTVALGKSGTLTFKSGEWGVDGSSNPLFTVNGDKPSFDITVTVDDSLDSIAKKINDADSKVQASVITIDGKVQLLVTAESGKKNALEITSDNTAQLGGFEYNTTAIAALDPTNPAVVQTQQGQDAEFKLNGLAITRETNNIKDVIPGLDFTLNKADVGKPIAFSISQDKSSAETAIRALVEAFNTLNTTLKPLIGVTKNDKNEDVTGALARDGTAKTLASALNLAFAGTVNGLKATDKFSSLASVGIITERIEVAGSARKESRMKIDDEQFNKVFAEDFDKLADLFGTQAKSQSNFLELNTGTFAAKAKSGEYTVNVTQSPTQGSATGTAIASFPVDLSDGSSTFTVQVDSVSSESITLNGVYANAQELAAGLQSAINSDTNFNGKNLGVEVSVQGGAIQIESKQYGTSSKVQFTAASASFASKVGLDTSSTLTTGVNAKGTINGVEAFGSSNILLPAVNSDAYGLNVTIKEGTPLGDYKVSFTRGIAGDLSLLLSTTLADTGQIKNKEDIIDKEKKGLVEDQTNLDRKMTAYEARLQKQYAAMEKIVASLNQTKTQLTGLIDRLPFTAKK